MAKIKPEKMAHEAEARRLLQAFFVWIEEQCFRCPSKSEVDDFCRRNKLTPCYG